MPALSKVRLDCEKGLFDRIEVRRIGGEENKLARCLVFDRSANFLRVVDTTIVKYEYTPRARVRIGEGNDKFLEKVNEAL